MNRPRFIPLHKAQIVHGQPVLVRGDGVTAWAVWISQPTPASDDAGAWYYTAPGGHRGRKIDFTIREVAMSIDRPPGPRLKAGAGGEAPGGDVQGRRAT